VSRTRGEVRRRGEGHGRTFRDRAITVGRVGCCFPDDACRARWAISRRLGFEGPTPSPATSGCALPFRRQPSKRGQPIRTSRTNRPDPGPIAEGTNAITSDAFSSHSPDVDLNSNVSSLHARAPLPTAWLATDEAVARLIGPRPIDPSIQVNRRRRRKRRKRPGDREDPRCAHFSGSSTKDRTSFFLEEDDPSPL
jgi:hypothetical protein